MLLCQLWGGEENPLLWLLCQLGFCSAIQRRPPRAPPRPIPHVLCARDRPEKELLGPLRVSSGWSGGGETCKLCRTFVGEWVRTDGLVSPAQGRRRLPSLSSPLIILGNKTSALPEETSHHHLLWIIQEGLCWMGLWCSFPNAFYWFCLLLVKGPQKDLT